MKQHAGYFLFTATWLIAATGLAGCSKPPETTASFPASSAASANVADMDVTQNVKTALGQSETLKSFDIAVVTLKGDVRLIGMVDSQAQIDEAVKIARAADGAHTIHEELTLKK
jgi:osmotically-inducible protein OsmY